MLLLDWAFLEQPCSMQTAISMHVVLRGKVCAGAITRRWCLWCPLRRRMTENGLPVSWEHVAVVGVNRVSVSIHLVFFAGPGYGHSLDLCLVTEWCDIPRGYLQKDGSSNAAR